MHKSFKPKMSGGSLSPEAHAEWNKKTKLSKPVGSGAKLAPKTPAAPKAAPKKLAQAGGKPGLKPEAPMGMGKKVSPPPKAGKPGKAK